ncbi:uncharacterized protein LOC143879089 isoform X2 [Tasmannia lanceolata]|uniref:uncharacterized protein LOC143879089 isoform X2 n=1 Tax=Tasmannia lanceolata TaxID=3420 RepID=UPI00406374DB
MEFPPTSLSVDSFNNVDVMGESSRKWSLENNGDASSDYPLKFKQRKVSAIRDFPAGCGRFAMKMDEKPSENVASVDNAQNTTVKLVRIAPLGSEPVESLGVSVDSESRELSRSLDPMELPDLLKAPKPEMVEELKSLGPTESPELSRALKDDATEFLKSSDQTELADVSRSFDQSKPMEMPISLNQIEALDQPQMPVSLGEAADEPLPPPPGRVSAIRDFPPFCGRDAPLVAMEECLKAVASFRKKSVDGLPRAVKIDNVKGNSIGNDTDRIGKKVQVGDSLVRKSDVADKKELVKFKSPFRSSVIGDDTDEVSDRVHNRAKLKGVHKKELHEKSLDRAAHDSKSYQSGATPQYISKKPYLESENLEGKVGKEYQKHSEDKSYMRKLMGGSEDKKRVRNQFQGEESMGLDSFGDRIFVQALMAAPNCLWRQGKRLSNSSPFVGKQKVRKEKIFVDDLQKSVSKRKDKGSLRKTEHNKLSPIGKTDSEHKNEGVGKDDEDSLSFGEEDDENALIVHKSKDSGVSLFPFGLAGPYSKGDDHEEIVTRNKVRETLRLFQAIYRKLLQEEEAKSREQEHKKRIDLAATKLLKEKNKWVNTGKSILGIVPGVEVGDEFHYRVELAIIGLHRPFQSGIDYLNEGGEIWATSIVASGGYADEMDSSDVLIYSGQGGNPVGGDKKPEDQKLVRGNLALKNSMDARKPVRVIHGFKELLKGSDSLDTRAKSISTFMYDGLYLVENFWKEQGRHGCSVFKFQLRRIPGQPELAMKEVKKSKKLKVRPGLCVADISQGNEKMPICAVNNIDDERPLPFKYITKIIYPSWYNPTPPKGCDCTDGCSDSKKCFCAYKNGGEFPFNYSGAIVEAKPLVYECGPSCKCPPSCPNRVSQHGIKFQLEIFKTESRGWGVRSLISIPSGSFICEYTGELLQDTEAEQRTGNDEYLFDIGHNYNDHALWDGLSTLIPPDLQSSAFCEVVEDVGFTIDAVEYGSVGRFINHSCSPNLYAQNLLYDHDDKRMPHIMLFAAENIPPLQELTYHYNYTVDQERTIC